MRPYIFKISKRTISLMTIFSMVGIFVLSSCRDVFETDLTGQDITVVMPVDSALVTDMTVQFKWQEVDGASGYRLEIVQPSFAAPTSYEFDSTISTTEAFIVLNPGEYQWRVSATNHSSSSNYETRTLYVDSTFDLSTQTMNLITPENGYYTKDSIISFACQEFLIADQYNFVVKEGTNWSTANDVEDVIAYDNVYTSSNIFDEGNYMWHARAENNLPSITAYSNQWTFHVDQTAPPASNIVEPIATTTPLYADSTFLFDWTRPTDGSTVQAPNYDRILIYSDTTQTAISTYEILNEDSTLTLPSTAGDYWWRIQSFDAVGNEQTESIAVKFVVQ